MFPAKAEIAYYFIHYYGFFSGGTLLSVLFGEQREAFLA
jgi:hypothetical protein